MNILTVYPITRGVFKEELTYWSPHPFKVGYIIDVPLRGRSIPALVGSVTPVKNAKSLVKQASFVTRKIEKSAEIRIVNPECIKACIDISEKYISPLGQTLKSCIPDIAFEIYKDEEKIVIDTVKDKSKENTKKTDDGEDGQDEPKISADIVVYQTNTDDRTSTYKSIIREEFARKKSVLIICPTSTNAQEHIRVSQKRNR
jgi:primosomal protein N'